MRSILLKKLKTALNNGQKKSIQLDVSNVNQYLRYCTGSRDPQESTQMVCRKIPLLSAAKGSGGQNFGAFIP